MSDFAKWLKTNTGLSDSSIYKYGHAADTVMEEMLALGVISKPFYEMTEIEIDIAIAVIIHDQHFIKKNTKGNAMYSNALKQYRAFRRDETVVNTDDIKTALQNESISETERQELIKARVGQGQFRKKVLQKYESRCIITGIDNPRLLLASHIKPWAVSSNAERLNSENGLCLSPAYDRLFDIGLISFSQKGQLRISSQLGVQNAKRLYIQAGMQFDLKSTPELLRNLEYHQDTIFIR